MRVALTRSSLSVSASTVALPFIPLPSGPPVPSAAPLALLSPAPYPGPDPLRVLGVQRAAGDEGVGLSTRVRSRQVTARNAEAASTNRGWNEYRCAL